MRLRGKRPTLLLAGQNQTSSLAPPQSGRSEGSKHGDKAHMNRDFFPCSWVTAARTPVWQSYLVLTYSWRTDTPRLYPLLLCMDMVPKAKTSCRSGGVWYGCLLYQSRHERQRAMLQYILGSELRHAVSLVHHESDQLCIFRPSQAARTQAIGAGARLYYFTGPESLGSGGHSYGHFVHSEELPAHAGGLGA